MRDTDRQTTNQTRKCPRCSKFRVGEWCMPCQTATVLQEDATMTHGELLIRRDVNCWTVDFSNTPEAATMRDLFGSPVLPTPYTPAASADRVRAAILQRNPGYTVRCV